MTIGKESFKLPSPFLVIATQNPVERAGTFELPDAQLDRFMLRHRLKYPEPDEEREVLRRNMALGVKRDGNGAIARTEFDVLAEEPVGTISDLVAAMESAARVHVSEPFLEHVVDLGTRTRSRPDIAGPALGPGSRSSKRALARALIRGRGHVVPDDLYALAQDVILHRIRLNYEALADGKSGKGVPREILRGLTRSGTKAQNRVQEVVAR